MLRAVDEVGATLNAALVVMGDRLGLYRALAGAGALTSGRAGGADRRRRALRARVAKRPGRRRLRRLPTPRDGRYSLTPEQAVSLTNENSPAYRPGSFSSRWARCGLPRITDALRSGAGFAWHEHNHGAVHEGRERFFRPGYVANLIASWLPALNGVVDKLQPAPASPTWAAATAPRPSSWPAPTQTRRFIGYDYHAASIETARGAQAEAGVEDRVRFEVAACHRVQRLRAIRPGGDLRLPARHGRPRRGGATRPVHVCYRTGRG